MSASWTKVGDEWAVKLVNEPLAVLGPRDGVPSVEPNYTGMAFIVTASSGRKTAVVLGRCLKTFWAKGNRQGRGDFVSLFEVADRLPDEKYGLNKKAWRR